MTGQQARFCVSWSHPEVQPVQEFIVLTRVVQVDGTGIEGR
jgi:hypothetical protein